ncbi:glycosyltransferase family 2 protein [Fibrobacter sp.]|uniref:glycosyltransferase family 2 protein n=1 Tax=Fibrobacter sp. TaxID=35828 RepID=UPI0025BCCA29|nr:glycosyltransferase family 2 protein [Fibrobacter sp.]MBR4008641.1 glycosyltransferase family 2 protein [Fibrobacter sp.]
MIPDYFIFVPAYNVAATLAGVLGRIPLAVMERAQVLVIDDGSKDDTRGVYETFVAKSAGVAGEASAADSEVAGNAIAGTNCVGNGVAGNNRAAPSLACTDSDCTGDNRAAPGLACADHLQYMRFERNLGYGAVVKRGISEGLRSGAKYIACLHGDGQYPAEKLDEFFAHLETAGNPPENTALENVAPEFDPCGQPEVGAPAGNSSAIALVQGSRRLVPGGARAGNMPLYKRLGGAFLTALENVAFRQKLTDRHSGFIVYSTDFLKTLDLQKLSPSFDIDLEIISIADARGCRLAELPIPTRYAGEKSNLNVVTYGLRVLRQTWRRFCLR